MKHYKLILLVASTSLLAFACRKTDTLQDPNMGVVPTEDAAGANTWISGQNWKSTQAKNSTVNYVSFEDGTINSSEGKNGMLVVYMKRANGINTLPFEEQTANGTINWFFQQSGNTITIQQQGKSGLPFSTDRQFMHILLSSDQLNSLNEKGYSEEAILGLTPDQLLALIR